MRTRNKTDTEDDYQKSLKRLTEGNASGWQTPEKNNPCYAREGKGILEHQIVAGGGWLRRNWSRPVQHGNTVDSCSSESRTKVLPE